MNKLNGLCFGLYPLLVSLSLLSDWGFFGHRLINEMAVYTLPPELQVIFKPEINYITEHAVDPDKRRYAIPSEGFHHYIDLDNYGEFPFTSLPRDWDSAITKYSQIRWISSVEDTIIIKDAEMEDSQYGPFISKYLGPNRYSEEVLVHCDTFKMYFNSFHDQPCDQIIIVDSLSVRGDLPYHLNRIYSKLTNAFMEKDIARIIRISTDLGHYIADAHVPLHTTSNYDGQLTGQHGIHAFWESRIPELFARSEYDFFIGKAAYREDKSKYFWDIVLNSHLLVSKVLASEAKVRNDFPDTYQFCFEDRLNQTVKTQCKEFALAFHRELEGMVEKQLRKAIKAVGDCWFSAWIDAGQPDFSFAPHASIQIKGSDSLNISKGDNLIRNGPVIRAHE